MNGDTSANFSAPTSGPLAGILFFQDRSIPGSAAGSTMSGNSTSTFDGALYFPTTQVTFSGNSSPNGYSIVVADKVDAQRQLDDGQQLHVADRRLADKGNDTGRMRTNNNMTAVASARGQVMVLVCVSLIAIMGMIAVVTDFSFMQHQRNMMQTAADSAAMAGSEELSYGDQVAAGKADAASNGYTDGASSVTVAINNPPSTGPNASKSAIRRGDRHQARADLFSARAGSQHDDRVGARGRVRGQRS